MLFQPKNNDKLQVPFTYIQTETEAIPVLESLLEEYLLGVDTETTGLDPHINKVLLLQISSSRKNYVFNILSKKVFKTNSKSLFLLNELLGNPDIIKIGHNAGFDFKMILSEFGITTNTLFDTMLAELLLNPRKNIKPGLREKLPSLNDLCYKYLGFNLEKVTRKEFYSGYKIIDFTQEQLQYSANDTAPLVPLYYVLIEKLEEFELMPTMELETRCLPVVGMMEYNGMVLDADKWRNYLIDLEEKVHNLDNAIVEHLKSAVPRRNLWGKPMINISSNTQILEALNKIGIPLEDTKDSTLRLAEKLHPVIPLLLKWRESEILITTFGESLLQKINKVTGRLHGDFLQLGTGSGRMSSNDPNLQNIPRDMFRDCFIAPEGYVWISADFSGQEYRVMASLAGEQGVLDGYKKGLDFHSKTAIMVYKHNEQEFIQSIESYKKKKKNDPDSITEFEKLCDKHRYDCKTMNFLANYGGGAKRLAQVLNIPVEEAKEKLDAYNKGLAKMKEFREFEGERSLKRMYSETLLGRKRFYEIKPDVTEEERNAQEASIKRKGVNQIIQGTCADMTKLALVLIHNDILEQDLDAQIISTVHDEINVYARNEIKDKVSTIVRDRMEEAFYQFIPKETCPIIVDINTGEHWIH